MTIFSGSTHVVKCLLKSVLALVRHVSDIAVGLLRGVVDVSEEVVIDAWAFIEGAVQGIFGVLTALLARSDSEKFIFVGLCYKEACTYLAS